jgi:hypothetical protein
MEIQENIEDSWERRITRQKRACKHIVPCCAPATATVQVLGVNLRVLLTPTCHESWCPWQVINAIVWKMLVLLVDTFTITVTVTTITGPVVLLASLHWFYWSSFPGRLLASNWLSTSVRYYHLYPLTVVPLLSFWPNNASVASPRKQSVYVCVVVWTRLLLSPRQCCIHCFIVAVA